MRKVDEGDWLVLLDLVCELKVDSETHEHGGDEHQPVSEVGADAWEGIRWLLASREVANDIVQNPDLRDEAD